MIISDHKKVIFIHNPKCAGTTVRKSLEQIDSRNNYYWMFDTFQKVKIDKAHMPLYFFKLYSPLDYKLLDEYFSFGFVRDPYSRYISAFNEIHKPLYNKFISNEVSINEYKNKINNFAKNLTYKNTQGWNIENRHFIQQKMMFYIGNKRKIDLIIKLEEIDNGTKKINIFKPEINIITNDWINKEKIKNKKKLPLQQDEILSVETKKYLFNIYKDDFIIFDYEK